MRDFKKLQRALDIGVLSAPDVQDELEKIGEILLEMEETSKTINAKEESAEALARCLTGIQWNYLMHLLGADDPLTLGGRKEILKRLIDKARRE